MAGLNLEVNLLVLQLTEDVIAGCDRNVRLYTHVSRRVHIYSVWIASLCSLCILLIWCLNSSKSKIRCIFTVVVHTATCRYIIVPLLYTLLHQGIPPLGYNSATIYANRYSFILTKTILNWIRTCMWHEVYGSILRRQCRRHRRPPRTPVSARASGPPRRRTGRTNLREVPERGHQLRRRGALQGWERPRA